MEKTKTVIVPAHTLPAKEIPEQTKEVYEGTYCDICKEKICGGANYDLEETEIRMKRGYCYPEGGIGTETTFDICMECFKEKLIPFFESFGGKPLVTDWRY